ncbi:MAG: sulfotransferase [Pseudomonadota bacterium]
MKYFCIGLTKTGTTSFNRLMASLDCRTHGFSRALLFEYLNEGQTGPKITAAIEGNDAFDDWPWPFLYKELNQKLGDEAYFVLTKRASPEQWLASIKRYALNSRTQRIRQLTYGTEFPHGFETHYLARYKSHLEEVRSYFAHANATHRLFEVEIGDPSLPERLSALTGRTPTAGFEAHSNKSPVRPRVARENLVTINKSLRGLGKPAITLEEAGFKNPSIQV